MASGILDTPLSHADVVRVANEAKDKFENLILNVLTAL
jgi:purine nucleoside phosphorylase